MPAQNVLIDTDPATGYAFRDVDDGLAMLYLLSRPEEFRVLGVTPVYGNTSLERTTVKAREVLKVARREEIPVSPGAASSRELGKSTAATRLLRRTVAAFPGEVTILALGPLTNVATAGLTDRGFFGNVRRVVVMGGACPRGFGVPFVPPLEFNFLKDPRAADFLLAAPCEKVLVTADLCRQVLFTRRELDSLWGMRSAVATYLAYRIEPWLRLNQVAPLPWRGGFVPWDVVAAVYLGRPDLFGGVEVKGMRLARGHLPTGAIEPDPSRDSTPCLIPTRITDPAGLLDEFLRTIAARG